MLLHTTHVRTPDQKPADDSSKSWSITVGLVSQISLAVQLTDSGVKAKVFHHMRGKSGGTPVFWDIDLRVRPTVTFRSSHQMVPNLLFDTVSSEEDWLDPFLQEGLNLALHYMGTRVEMRNLPDREIAESFRRMQRHLRERLLPRASEAARRFPPTQEHTLRWDIYSLVAEDPTGRLWQMTKTFPWLIPFVLEIQKQVPGAYQELLAAIVSGKALEEILDLAVRFQSIASHCSAHQQMIPGGSQKAEKVQVVQPELPTTAGISESTSEPDATLPSTTRGKRAFVFRPKRGLFVQGRLNDLPGAVPSRERLVAA